MRRREPERVEDQDREDAARREDQARSDAELLNLYVESPPFGAPVERAGLAREEAAMRERGRHPAGEDHWWDIEFPDWISPEPELRLDPPVMKETR